MQSLFDPGAISGCAQVEEQPSGRGEEQRCFGLVGLSIAGMSSL